MDLFSPEYLIFAEYAATFLALSYILLVIAEKRISWLFAIASSFIYIFIFWNSRLYYQSILQLFFIAISYSGWKAWANEADNRISISSLGVINNILLFSIFSGLSFAAWAIMTYLSDSSAAAFDATTSAFSILATILMTRKKIESWHYWIIIDTISVWMFIRQQLYFTSFVYACFGILAFAGLLKWSRK